MGSLNWSMNWIDTCALATYLVGITLFGIWVGFRKNTSSKPYFLANRSLGWSTVGAAVFTSNISTIHLIGLAASGAKEMLRMKSIDSSGFTSARAPSISASSERGAPAPQIRNGKSDSSSARPISRIRTRSGRQG